MECLLQMVRLFCKHTEPPLAGKRLNWQDCYGGSRLQGGLHTSVQRDLHSGGRNVSPECIRKREGEVAEVNIAVAAVPAAGADVKLHWLRQSAVGLRTEN